MSSQRLLDGATVAIVKGTSIEAALRAFKRRSMQHLRSLSMHEHALTRSQRRRIKSARARRRAA